MGLQRTPPPSASAAPLLPRPLPPAYLSPSGVPVEAPEEVVVQKGNAASPSPALPPVGGSQGTTSSAQASSSRITLDAPAPAPASAQLAPGSPRSTRPPTSKRAAKDTVDSPQRAKSARREAVEPVQSGSMDSPARAEGMDVPESPRPRHAVPVAPVGTSASTPATEGPADAEQSGVLAPAPAPMPTFAIPSPPQPMTTTTSAPAPAAPADAPLPPASRSVPAPAPEPSARTSTRSQPGADTSIDDAATSKHYDMLCQALEVAVRKGANKWTVKDLEACFPSLAETYPAAFEQMWETIAKSLREKMLADAHATFQRVNLPKSLKLFRGMLEQGVPAGEDKPDAYRAELEPSVAVTAAMLPIWDDLWTELREDYVKAYSSAATLADDVQRKQLRLAELEAEIQASTIELDATVKILQDVPNDDMQHWMEDVMSTLGRAAPAS